MLADNLEAAGYAMVPGVLGVEHICGLIEALGKDVGTSVGRGISSMSLSYVSSRIQLRFEHDSESV
jgi:hypothetical protein